MPDCNVLIVGAGPVGLTLAIDLAWRGIDVTVVETRKPYEPPEPKCNHAAARPPRWSGLLHEMRAQQVIGGLVEERRFLGGRLQEMLVLDVDVVAENARPPAPLQTSRQRQGSSSSV